MEPLWSLCISSIDRNLIRLGSFDESSFVGWCFRCYHCPSWPLEPRFLLVLFIYLFNIFVKTRERCMKTVPMRGRGLPHTVSGKAKSTFHTFFCWIPINCILVAQKQAPAADTVRFYRENISSTWDFRRTGFLAPQIFIEKAL